jgi:nitrate/nitrite transport system substrate-binding protein
MQDAWIYASTKSAGSTLAGSLAELGFTPRSFARTDALHPDADARTVRAPALIVVAAGRGEPGPDDVCVALRKREELADVPLVVAIEPEHLDASEHIVDVNELLVRPFTQGEFRTRVARARRLAGGAEAGELLRIGALELNLVTYRVSIDDAPIGFTYMEYELLKFLMMHPGRVFSREALLKRVWGYDYYGGARTVDVHIRRLRAKLGPEHAARIRTIRSVGYQFEGAAAVAQPAVESRGITTRNGDRPRPDARADDVQRVDESVSPATVRVGFVALTDAAPVIMAHELGFFHGRGLDVTLVKQPSWSSTRDALLSGAIDAAHCPFSLPFSVATEIGGAADGLLKVAMMLNQNGQGITLREDWVAAGYDNLKRAKSVMHGGEGQTFAMTFPGGTHDTWLRYWLKAMGIELSVPRIIPIPPPQMVANMRSGNMDGFCVGEPWNSVAAEQGLGFTELATQDLWEFHPEKALVVGADFSERRTVELKKLMGALLDTCKWLDDPRNHPKVAATLGRPEYVATHPSLIEQRLGGVYELGAGLGTKVFTGDQMRFCRDGEVNFPRRAHAIWFMAQYVRFGYLTSEPSYEALANELILTELYKQVADEEGVGVPDDDMLPFEIALDRITFDPRRPEREAMRA